MNCFHISRLLLCLLMCLGMMLAQEGEDKTIASRWIFQEAIKGVTYTSYIYLYTDSTFLNHEAEAENTFYGRYTIIGDTLIMVADSSRDMHHFTQEIFKWLIIGDLLKPLAAKFDVYQEGWYTEFDSTYFFKRDTTR